MSVGGQYWYANEPAYELTTKGGRITFAKQRERSDPVRRKQSLTTLSVTFVDECEDYTVSEAALNDPAFYDDLIALGLNPNTGRGQGQLLALSVDVQRNTTPNLIDARSGLPPAAARRAGRAVDARRLQLHRVHGRGRASTSRSATSCSPAASAPARSTRPGVLAANIPFFKRYFLGGSSSLRGWGRFEISPLTFSGTPIGGHSMFESSGEMRIPAFGQFAIVGFVDAGNVWYESFDINLDDLRVDVGPGLRYRTPIGPVRVGPRLPVDAHRRPARRRRARASPLAHPLQHRAGVLTMARGRRALRALAILAVLLVGLMVVAAVLYADGVVPRAGAPPRHAPGRQGDRRARSSSARSRATSSRASRCATSSVVQGDAAGRAGRSRRRLAYGLGDVLSAGRTRAADHDRSAGHRRGAHAAGLERGAPAQAASARRSRTSRAPPSRCPTSRSPNGAGHGARDRRAADATPFRGASRG